MRFLTPIKILKMEEKDIIVILILIILIYKNINTIDDIVDIL